MEELWRPVHSLNDKYEVSNFGRIRNAHTGKILRTFINKWGYSFLAVRPEPNHSKNVQIHCLVAEAFIGPRPSRMDVNHKDGNKLNNHPGNLEYVTRSQNNQHALNMGLRHPADMRKVAKRGEENRWAKITVEDAKHVLQIREETGFGERRISKMTGLPLGAVSGIIQNRTWKHLRRNKT